MIAVIPARGGSKRIPRKNIRDFHGRPMMSWPISEAKVSELFDAIYVSTEDEEIACVARDCGADVIWRSKELADDHVPITVVMHDAVKAFSGEYACLIYATAPMLRAKDLKTGYEALVRHRDKSFALGVTTFAFPIQRALRSDCTPFYPRFRDTRSQDLEMAYHDAGQFCWGRSDAWLRVEPIFSSRTIPIVLPRCIVQDIDTEEDWEMAERLVCCPMDAKASMTTT